jgi:hypothetical protein
MTPTIPNEKVDESFVYLSITIIHPTIHTHRGEIMREIAQKVK